MNTVTAGRFRLLIGAAAAAAVMTGCGPGSSPGSSAASSPASPNTATASSAASAVAAAASSAAAVATSAAPAAASGSGDVCSMLSAAQASAINKVTYGPGVPKAVQSDWDECTYPNKGSADPVDIQALTVDVVRISGCWDQFKQIDGPGTAVAGVGDAAFGYEIGLDVESGSTCVTIKGLTHAEFSGDHSRDIAIAKIVLASLH